jgi:GDP-L-fucose synthase
MLDIGGSSIWVAGHTGMVGSALVRRLQRQGVKLITPAARIDLRQQSAVNDFVASVRPDAVILAAAKVGGIVANETCPADFLYDNLMIAANVIEAAHRHDVDRLLFLGSSCIYPRLASQPIAEAALLTGALEPTNEGYAVAKIAGVKLVETYRRQYGRNYIAAMPCNLYGPGDNFHPDTSHVLPALIRKAHVAKTLGDKSITIWGTGTPRREFLHVDDCAEALVFLLRTYDGVQHVNVGSGTDLSIMELTRLVCDVVGFGGAIDHDLRKPDGTPRKLMSSETLRTLGWQPSIPLRDGIHATYRWFLEHAADI